ncbi:MAG: GNAT family N-acetyltransferase [Candidatus Thorarchaeota archaeon SMTZ1-83]
MDDYTFTTHFSKDQQGKDAIQEGQAVLFSGLESNITEKTGITQFGQSIAVFMRNDAGGIVGGIIGNTFGGWLDIFLLWVEKSLRGMGYGSRLMDMVESEAVSMGCTNAHLDTFSFEARAFYERLGYEMFAVLTDYPEGHLKCFLKKRLVS